MPLIKNAELWFAKVDPDRPNRKFNKKNPTWEVQLRTKDKAQKKEWEAQGLSVKTIDPDDDSGIYYRVNLRKRTIKADGEPSSPVEVIYGNKKPCDPTTIGNGSIGNVRIYQYPFENEAGEKGTASVLMGIQLTKHIMYTPKARDDDFEEEETEIIEEEESEDDESSPEAAPDEEESGEEAEGEAEEEAEVEEKPKAKAPSIKKPVAKDKFD
jgi:hypothetical protein